MESAQWSIQGTLLSADSALTMTDLLRFLSTDAKLPLSTAMGYAKTLTAAKLTKLIPVLRSSLIQRHFDSRTEEGRIGRGYKRRRPPQGDHKCREARSQGLSAHIIVHIREEVVDPRHRNGKGNRKAKIRLRKVRKT
jgi:hypothetical protein